MPLHLEAISQRTFVHRVRMDARTKHLLFTSVPLGGYRNAREAALLKAEGANAGCPDLLFFEPSYTPDPGIARSKFVGLAIEMKAGKNKPTKAQMEWHAKLSVRGWYVATCYSADEAWETLFGYLGLKVTP